MVAEERAYEVVVPPELVERWSSLPARDHERLSSRLQRAAREAWSSPVVWPEGSQGIHRGRHRAIVDELWLLYRLNDRAGTVDLIGFGHVKPV